MTSTKQTTSRDYEYFVDTRYQFCYEQYKKTNGEDGEGTAL
jgi:hypothetical protein